MLVKLQEIRKNKGLSQAKLAEVSGINLRTLQQYEAGTRSLDGAKLSSLLDLCEALDCKLSEIVEAPDLRARLEKLKM